MHLHVSFSSVSEMLSTDRLNEYMAWLPMFERHKICQYRDWHDRQLSLFGKLLLLRGLHDLGYSAIKLDSMKLDPYYRPYFSNYGLDFNISHSGTHVICVIGSCCRVGVDLEMKRPIPLQDFSYQFREDEWDDIMLDENQLDKFYEYWTRKEAIIKFDGKGLNIPLKHIFINGNKATLYNRDYYLLPVSLHNEYSCHIALDFEMELPPDSIREIRW